jgi:hypothetical protein
VQNEGYDVLGGPGSGEQRDVTDRDERDGERGKEGAKNLETSSPAFSSVSCSSFALNESAVSPRRLQSMISRAQTVEACLDVVKVYSKFLDDVHVASLYNRVAELKRAKRGGGGGGGDDGVSELVFNETFKHLVELVKLHLRSMNPRSLSTVANACGKLKHCDCDIILSHIRHRVNNSAGGSSGLRDFSAKDLENIIWAHGKLKLRLPEGELDEWLGRLSENTETLNARSLTQLLYSCQRLRYKPGGDTMATMAALIQSHAPKMSLKALANVLSSLAHLQSLQMVDSIELLTTCISQRFEEIAEEEEEELMTSSHRKHRKSISHSGGGRFNLRNIANVLWSFAELQHYPPEKLLDTLDQVAAPLVEAEGNPLVLNTYLRACHKLARKPRGEILEGTLVVISKTFETTFPRRGGDFSNEEEGGEEEAKAGADLRETCRLIKSVIMLNQEVPREQLGDLERGLCDLGFDDVTLHDALWSFGTSRFGVSEDFKGRAMDYFEANIQRFRTGAYCRILWSLTILDICLRDQAPMLLERFGGEAQLKISHSTGLLLWAMKGHGCAVPKKILDGTKRHCSLNWDSMTPTEILYTIDILSHYDMVDATDATWMQPALNRARTFVIR